MFSAQKSQQPLGFRFFFFLVFGGHKTTLIAASNTDFTFYWNQDKINLHLSAYPVVKFKIPIKLRSVSFKKNHIHIYGLESSTKQHLIHCSVMLLLICKSSIIFSVWTCTVPCHTGIFNIKIYGTGKVNMLFWY
jgi:hypothetical protein